MKTETVTRQIPMIREYGEVNILVETKERQETETRYYTDNRMSLPTIDGSAYNPYKELERIIYGKKYELKLVRGYSTTDKPLLIIKEL